MKKIISVLSSAALMGALLIVLAVSMGIATFVENDFGTNAAKALYYNAWWFEGIFLLLGVNMILKLMQPGLWKKGRVSVVFFHLSFVLIIIGAALTRYVGFEGTMHIREGEQTNQFLSSDNYIQGTITENNTAIKVEEHVFMSVKSKDELDRSYSIDNKRVLLKSVDFIPEAEIKPVEDINGVPLLTIMVSHKSGRQNISLQQGEAVEVGAYKIGFEYPDSTDFNIYLEDEALCFSCTHEVFITNMANRERTSVDLDKEQLFYENVLFSFEDVFVIQTGFLAHASFKAIPSNSQSGISAVVVEALVDEEKDYMYLVGNKDMVGEPVSKNINGVDITLSYGAKLLETPFVLKLNDFQLERYTGSESPSSFASEVTLIDEEKLVTKDYRIFMNNILNYRGYRFYQSSYDSDEKGTILSVNNDFWGTTITYIGYALMTLFMALAVFASKSRFQYLSAQLKNSNKAKKVLGLIIMLGLTNGVFAQDISSFISVSEEQAEKFGNLWVQNSDGRFKPMNTLSGEIMRKLVKHNSFRGYSADRVLLSILCNPEQWANVPLITVKSAPIKQIVGNVEKKASFRQFFDEKGNYKLSQVINNAYRTKPAYRSKLQNELIKIDEQVNVFSLAQSGSLLNIFPHSDDVNVGWETPAKLMSQNNQGDQLSAAKAFFYYLDALKTNNKEEAEQLIDALYAYQKNKASDVLPSDKAKEIEVFYNSSNIFLMIAPFVSVLGILLLLIQFAYLLMPQNQPGIINKIGAILVVGIFLLYTSGLGLRWYISGHAPWSDGYESMLYIGWSVLLAGLIFYKKAPFVLSLSALFSGIVLFVAHLSWMNPEITNLVPVLKSYWLTIHVAVIVGSYGFLSLGALIGFVNLILLGLQRPKGDDKVKNAIKELSYVSEMGLTIGLYTLTIGSFLGGVWANESWGRYWGWDPKETWSMVTILVYAFVMHMRMIPALKGLLWYNVASVVAFFSVIMTYLGVNYYLAGMHSYAKGDAVPIPSAIYYMLITVLVTVIFAVLNQYKITGESVSKK